MSEVFGADDTPTDGSVIFGADDTPAEKPVKPERTTLQKVGDVASNVLGKFIEEPKGEWYNEAKLGVRGLADLPLGAIQLGLDNTGLGKSDVAQSIQNVANRNNQLRNELNTNYPHSETSHSLAEAVPKMFQAGITNPAFDGLAIPKLLNYAKNVGVGAGTGEIFGALQPRGEASADERNAARAQAGGSGATGAGLLTAGMPPLSKLAASLMDRFSPMSAAANRFTDVASSLGGSPDDVVNSIQQNKATANDIPGYNPTTAQLAQNPGIASLERGARSPSAGNISNELAMNDLQNRGAISNLVEGISPNDPDAINALRGTVANVLNNTRAKIANSLGQASSANDLAQQMQKMVSDRQVAGLPTQDRSDISTAMSNKLEDLFKSNRAEKGKLFGAIDPTGKVPISTTPLKQPLQEQLDNIQDPDIRAEAATHPTIQKILNLPEQISFKQLQEYRPLLSKSLSESRRTNDGLMTGLLGATKGALEDYTPALAENRAGWLFGKDTVGKDVQAEAGQRAQAAMDFYKNTFAPRWKTGPGQAFAQGVSRFQPQAPEVVGSKFLRSGDIGASTWRNLNEMIKADPTLQPVVEQHVLADMQQTPGMVDDNGIINPNKLGAWSNKNKELLKQMPALNQKVEGMYQAVKDAADNSDEMAQGLKSAQKNYAEQDKALNQSSLAKLIGSENTSDVIGTVLNSDNPTRDIKTLVNLTKQDKSGRAMKGLQQATYDHLKDVLTNTQTRVGDNAPMNVSLSKLDSYLDTPQKVSALRMVIGQDGINKMMAARKGLQMMSTLNNFQNISGSATSQNEAAAGMAKRMLNGAFHIVTGHVPVIRNGVFVADKLMKNSAGALVQKALLDPDFAATLLKYQPTHPAATAIKAAVMSGIPQGAIGQAQQ